MKTTIRRARAGDLDALVALEATFPGDRLSRRQLRTHAAGHSHSIFLVAVRGGVLVGDALVFLRRGSRRARLYSIVVAPSARGFGLGAALLDAAERAACGAGAGTLALEVRTGNRAALALYARRGYHRIGRIARYYEDGADAWRYAKPLAAPRRIARRSPEARP